MLKIVGTIFMVLGAISCLISLLLITSSFSNFLLIAIFGLIVIFCGKILRKSKNDKQKSQLLLPEEINGRKLSDNFQQDIVGIKYYNPRMAKKLKPGTEIILKPEPENPHDKKAVAAYTIDGIMLGHIENSTRKGSIFSALNKGIGVKASVADFRYFNDDDENDENFAIETNIYIFYSRTEEEEIEYEKEEQKKREERAQLGLTDIENSYLNQIVNILKSDGYDTSEIVSLISSDDYFKICDKNRLLFRFRISKRLNYWLAPLPEKLFKKRYKTGLKIMPATTSEGNNSCRVFLETAADLMQYKDLIIERYQDQYCRF